MKLKFLNSLLAESPQNEQRIKRAGWKPVRVRLILLYNENDPAEFMDVAGPSEEMEATLWVSPSENKVYTRSAVDDEVTGRIVRVRDGLALVAKNRRWQITYVDNADRKTLTAHV